MIGMHSALSQTNSFRGTLSCQFCRTLPHEHYLATEKSNPPPPVNPHYIPPPSDHPMEVLQPVAQWQSQSDAHTITMELGSMETAT